MLLFKNEEDSNLIQNKSNESDKLLTTDHVISSANQFQECFSFLLFCDCQSIAQAQIITHAN